MHNRDIYQHGALLQSQFNVGSSTLAILTWFDARGNADLPGKGVDGRHNVVMSLRVRRSAQSGAPKRVCEVLVICVRVVARWASVWQEWGDVYA
jgi:hypothetical protein